MLKAQGCLYTMFTHIQPILSHMLCMIEDQRYIYFITKLHINTIRVFTLSPSLPIYHESKRIPSVKNMKNVYVNKT